MAKKRDSFFVPVKLLIQKTEHIKRITQLSRRDRFKSIDPQDAQQTKQLLNIKAENLIEIEVTTLSAQDVAGKIMEKVNSLMNK